MEQWAAGAFSANPTADAQAQGQVAMLNGLKELTFDDFIEAIEPKEDDNE